jgi:hypothetical protein
MALEEVGYLSVLVEPFGGEYLVLAAAEPAPDSTRVFDKAVPALPVFGVLGLI